MDVWDSINVSDYPGLIVRLSDGRLEENHKQQPIFDLDSLGFPTLDAFDFSRYNNTTSLITSRGCPFACTFCSVFAIFGRKFRARSAESVVEELTYYSKRGVRTFNVEDDNFTFNMDRVDQLMEAICRADLDIELRFPNGITALGMTEERLKLMARAGVRQLFFGLESTDAETRRKLKKGFAKIDAIEALIHIARREGIYAFVSIIIGLPQQTPQDMADGYVETFLRGMADSANPYYPIAGTELFRQTEAEGLLLESDLEWYEPMNFPIEGKAFKRSDVADAFILGLALAHPSYKTFHRKFLQLTHLSNEDVLDALKQLHILVDVKIDGELLIAPDRCFCEEQALAHKQPATGTSEYPSEICTLSGRILQTVLQLWSGRSYICEEVMEQTPFFANLSQEVKIAELAAREAGKYLVDKFGHPKVELHKDLRDDLLDADLDAEHIILNRLRKEFPAYGILSEEAGDERKNFTTYWIVDPLDGSANYQHGNSTFALSIVLCINQVTVVGVIYIPMKDELFTAFRGRGVTLNGEPIQLSDTARVEDAIIHIGEFERDQDKVNRQQIRELIVVADNAKRMRMLGTSCTDLVWVACGRSDGFIMHGGNAWDIEAGKLILEEAGGKISRRIYSDGHMLTIYTNKHIHQALTHLLEREFQE